MNRYKYLLFVLVFSATNLNAQNRMFRAAINQTKFKGTPEKDATGKTLETINGNYGFSFALVNELDFSGNGKNGLRIEACFTRKNITWQYEGPSYFIFDKKGSTEKAYSTGQMNYTLNLRNNYFEIPVMAYNKFDNGIEIAGGLNFGMLISTRGKGSLTYNGKLENGSTIPAFTTSFNSNYEKDDENTATLATTPTAIGGENILIPQSIGAYYHARTKTGKAFNRFDLGINTDIAYWFSETIAMRFRLNYNFFDYTKDGNLFQQRALDGNKKPIARAEKDKILNLQLSLDIKLQ